MKTQTKSKQQVRQRKIKVSSGGRERLHEEWKRTGRVTSRGMGKDWMSEVGSRVRARVGSRDAEGKKTPNLSKLKKTPYILLKIIWFIIGGLILLWTIFWFIKMHTIQDLGVLAGAALFASGVYMLSIYLVITIIFIIIKFIVKKIIKRKSK